MAREQACPPCQLARVLLDSLLEFRSARVSVAAANVGKVVAPSFDKGNDTTKAKGPKKTKNNSKYVTALLRAPSLIPCPRLAAEVTACTEADYNYSPRTEIIKAAFGHEYEYILTEMLTNAGLAWATLPTLPAAFTNYAAQELRFLPRRPIVKMGDM